MWSRVDDAHRGRASLRVSMYDRIALSRIESSNRINHPNQSRWNKYPQNIAARLLMYCTLVTTIIGNFFLLLASSLFLLLPSLYHGELPVLCLLLNVGVWVVSLVYDTSFLCELMYILISSIA